MNQASAVISIDRHGRFVDSSGQFFPIGLYSVPHEDSFAELQRAGFNTVHSYEFERTCYLNLQCSKEVARETRDFDGLGDAAAMRYLDAAAAHGLKVAMGFNRPSGVSKETFSETGRQQVQERVKALRGHPALFAWYVADEPDGQEFDPELVERTRQFVESLDAAHPTLSVLCVPDKFAQYAQTAQVIMHDSYPLPNRSIDEVWPNLAKLKETVGLDTPTVAVLQAFDWKSYDWRMQDGHAPTLQELRCMAWQAIVANVSGILFFCYHNEAHSNRACDNPEGWAALSTVAGELQSLTPALLAPPADQMQCRTDDCGVAVTFRAVGDEIWIIATNPQPDSRRAVFALSGGGKALVHNCLDDSECFEMSGEFATEIEPYGVRAMRIAV